MTAILFILVLLILIFVHELGHFLIAKLSKIKVHEFALGFPPKIWGKKVGETEYTLNIVPFGGFVKIHGENPDELPENDPDAGRSMVNKPWYTQIAVLIAGITFNIIFAWMLITTAYMIGYPTASEKVTGDSSISIVSVAKDSPAEKAGISTGDYIVSISLGDKFIEPKSVEEVRSIIKASQGSEITLNYVHKGETKTSVITPETNNSDKTPMIGISMTVVDLLNYPFWQAPWEGLKTTFEVTKGTIVGLAKLIKDSLMGNGSLGAVTGPVGIAGMIGDASDFGFAYLLGFTAFISINLAVINLVPFPALDGGRIFVILIETISRRKIPAKIQAYVNIGGFLILIGLMVLVTIRDIGKLF